MTGLPEHPVTKNGRRLLTAMLVAVPLSVSALPGWGANISVGAAELESGFATITSDELATMLERKDFAFINVHVPYEGEIEQTDAFIAFDTIADNLDRLPGDRGARIVLYCQSGRMSEIAAGVLAERGFTNVSHLAGGMVGWQRSGRQIRNK